MCKILQLGLGLQKWLYNYSPRYQWNEYSNSEKAPGNLTEARKPSGLPTDPLHPLCFLRFCPYVSFLELQQSTSYSLSSPLTTYPMDPIIHPPPPASIPQLVTVFQIFPEKQVDWIRPHMSYWSWDPIPPSPILSITSNSVARKWCGLPFLSALIPSESQKSPPAFLPQLFPGTQAPPPVGTLCEHTIWINRENK